MLDIKKMQASAKKIAKNDKLFISRKGNTYFITNTFYMVVVNQGIYKQAFCTAAPEYKEIEDGQTIQRQDKRTMPEQANYLDCEQLIPQNGLKAIDETRFYIDMSYTNKKQDGKIYLNGSKIIAINKEYFETLEPFIQSDKLYQAENAKPETSVLVSGDIQAYTSDEFLTAVIFLPIRNELAKQEITITRNGEKPETSETASDETIEQAEEQAREILHKANLQAIEIVENAKAEAKHIENKAKQEAQAITEQAKEQAQEQAEKATEQHEQAHKALATIKRNDEHNGIELYFNAFPSSEIRNELKQNHFRWYPTKKCWYAKATDKNIALAERIAA